MNGQTISGKYISGAYKITNTANGKVYIGATSNLRDRKQHHDWDLRHHKHSNKAMQEDYDKNPDAFRFDVIEFCDTENLTELERKYIAEYDSMNPIYGYNRESGGNKDKTISSETKQIWSTHRKGEGGAMYGKHHTEEARRKISEKQIGKVLSEETKRKISSAKIGVRPSEETRRKWSETRKGRKLSPEHCAAISKGRKGIIPDEEWRRHMSESRIGKHTGAENKYHKDVICIETGELFHGVNEAGRKMGISATHISAACKGKRNVAGGYHWKYADESNTQQNVGSIFDNAVMA